VEALDPSDAALPLNSCPTLCAHVFVCFCAFLFVCMWTLDPSDAALQIELDSYLILCARIHECVFVCL